MMIQYSVRNHLQGLEIHWVPKAEGKPVKWNPKVFQTLTFGHHLSVADWLWIKVLQEEAIFHVKQGNHAAIYYYLDLLTKLDPLFFEAYHFGGLLLTVIRDDNKGAAEILKKGNRFRKDKLPQYPKWFQEKFWVFEWAIPMNLGYVYMFELGQFKKGVKAYLESASIKDAPRYIKKLARSLQTPLGRYRVGIRTIEMLMKQEKNREVEVKNKLQSKKEKLIVGRHVFITQKKWEKFLDQKRHLNSIKRKTLWKEFLNQFPRMKRDPLGGKVYLSKEKGVTSTSPHKDLFEL